MNGYALIAMNWIVIKKAAPDVIEPIQNHKFNKII